MGIHNVCKANELLGKADHAPFAQIDSKKELEKLLKATCEVFIMTVTKLTVEPMLSFITKVTAVRVASSLSSGCRLREQVPQHSSSSPARQSSIANPIPI